MRVQNVEKKNLPYIYIDFSEKKDIIHSLYLKVRCISLNNERERLGSRLGFIMLSAGCAIGCGNVWKFPWMTGQYGGGGFVLVYVL